MPKISVIIPVYNEEKVIGECLESLRLQTYKEIEIIVVDDGSSDTTLEKLENSRIPKLQVLKQEHKGAGAARNLGAKQAKGEILVFVDADMTFAPDFIEKLVGPIINGKAIGTFSKEEYLANSDSVWARCWNINRGLPPDRMLPKDYPDTQKVFRAILTSEFEKADGFDEKAGYTDDYSLADKLGVYAIAAPGAVFYHQNPDDLAEVFIQSKWMAKRKYKLGVAGYFAALARTNLLTSILTGLFLAIRHLSVAIIVFKIISDLGQFLGVLEYMFFGKVAK